ncbi:predicted protein [Aspergillus terreus NIH2624]|jgi:hypothetical protein|uniref:Uncharacterized protein n=1 Tax=Aspergillus terreus (strain NIH 2624 / FGSC A1156) TaxID=341663 RepID=Q0CP79_ASPTN|nr:uncharacterized protein ATEG_04505 [Aspergillus terreus NIH2624]EAU34952.1 predicted protein [Aspergillus terreus NIH2624]
MTLVEFMAAGSNYGVCNYLRDTSSRVPFGLALAPVLNGIRNPNRVPIESVHRLNSLRGPWLTAWSKHPPDGWTGKAGDGGRRSNGLEPGLRHPNHGARRSIDFGSRIALSRCWAEAPGT